jgi:protein-S-isoprenylcysteine O-methyltransferase Ste14
MKRYQDWAKREHSDTQWLITLALAGTLIVGIVPFLVAKASLALDRRLGLPDFYTGPINILAGLILAGVGLGLGLWSVLAEITIGKGTPVPLVPTTKLVVQPPFTYCRNPMTLGTIVAYLGLCVAIGSLSSLAIVFCLASLLILYIKRLEEKELAGRFGEAYLDYKRKTPFIIPRKLRP